MPLPPRSTRCSLARAKQTSRADARRRYRQTAAAEAEAVEGEEAGTAEAATSRARPTSGTPGKGGRPGLLGSFRNAYHPPHYAEDLRALPALLQSRWFLIALALEALGFVAIVVLPANPISVLAFETLTVSPAMVPIFLVGFTAPRASYLLGLIVGLVDVVINGLYLVYAGAQSGISVPVGTYLLNLVALGIPTSMVFAAAAAWYKRFLALSSPRRTPPKADRSKSRRAPAHR